MDSDFGAFELKERIGKGAMAMVYRAVQKSLQRPCVLKILYPHLAEDEKLVQRFEREARAAASMRHENIVQVIDCGRHEDMPFIAMEFVEGYDLRQWLDRHGSPPVEMALLILRDVCRGLEHAHARNIVHRDIKPANIMFTTDGTVKIMDFGLARSGTETSTQMTMVGSVLGTPAYMSPEQALGHAVDARSDIFSAGVLAYELLGGQRPFNGDTFSVVMHAILTVEPPELTTFNPLLSAETVRIVRSMLEKDLTKRFASVTLVREALEDVIEAMGLTRASDLLREYAHDPVKIAGILKSKRLSRHLDQGLYFENMGQGKIEDALLEFRRVLHLDPNHALAKDHQKKLERQRGRAAEAAITPPDTTATQVLLPAAQPRPTQSGPPASVPAGAKAQPVPPSSAAPGTKPPTAAARPEASAKQSGLGAKPGESAPAGPPRPSAAKSPAQVAAGKPTRGRLSPALLGLGALAAIVALVLGVRTMFPPRPSPVPLEEPKAPAANPETRSEPVVPTPSDTSRTPEPTPPDTPKDAFHQALLQADSTHWKEALRLATLAMKDSSFRRSPSHLKDRLLLKELTARALVRTNHELDARAIYRELLAANSKFTLTPRWLTSMDSATLAVARLEWSHPVVDTTRDLVLTKPLRPQLGQGTIILNVNPGSSILIDGKKAGEDVRALRVEVSSGRHDVVVTNSIQTKLFPLEVPAGGSAPLFWDAAGNAGSLDVESDPPGANFYLDDVFMGVTPLRVSAVAPTEHNFRVELNGLKLAKGPKSLKLKPGQSRVLKFRLK